MMKQLYAELIICHRQSGWYLKEYEESFLKMIGYTCEELQRLFNDDFLALFAQEQAALLEGFLSAAGPVAAVYPQGLALKCKGAWLRVVLQAEGAGRREIVRVSLSDITDMKELVLQKSCDVETDALTGLVNRYVIEPRCDALLKEAGGEVLCALLMLDLDDFKSINDTYGHIAGDEVLKHAADILRSLFSSPDTVLGRLGGDEMMVFLTNCPSLDYIEEAAGKICRSFSVTTGAPCPLSTSVGIAVAPCDGSHFSSLYKCADMALYQAKYYGKNRYSFFDRLMLKETEGKQPLSRDWLLEESNDLIYVSDMETYDMLYMNRGAVKMFGLEEAQYKGKKCYKVLQGLDAPCGFCTTSMLCRETSYTWEYFNPYIGRYFLLRDRIVDWYGQPARIEFATDVTSLTSRNQALQDEVRVAQIIIRCLRKMNSEKWLDDAVMLLLEELGAFYQADRAFIIRCGEGGQGSLSYQWTGEGVGEVELSGEEWQRYMDFACDCLKNREIRCVDDLEEIREIDEALYSAFIHNSTGSQRIVPLLSGRKLTGFIGLDNPGVFQNEFTLLETLGYFVMEEIFKRQLSERLVFLSYHDALTGLQNRNRFIEYSEQLAERSVKALGIAVADLNSLSEVNRYRGHLKGDQLVKCTAELFQACFCDAQIFRLSGDEFVIISEDQPKAEFIAAAQNAYESIERLDGFGISIGYAWTNRDIDMDRLSMQANDMMMVRKQRYYETVRESRGTSGKYKYDRIQSLMEEIQRGAFKVYLQPQVDSNTGRICGAEALARYESKEKVLYYPPHFIPELERDYLIKYLDIFMFEEVCRILARWKEEGKELFPIAVNFSRLTILEQDLPGELAELARKYQVATELIELEITESFGDYAEENIAEIGAAFKKMGFRLALDDFGSQYANMSTLSFVPVDVLKIDRSMINDLQGNIKKRSMIRHLLLLCSEMGIRCVAEGVETEEQRSLLQSFNCDRLQGFLFGKPMPMGEFEEKWME